MIAAAAIAASGVAPAAAQPESARFTRLSVEHGLSQSSVLQILQDRKGLIWFGTQEGLNRYDGYEFTVHRAREQDGFLRDHEINAIIEDARGGLWVGTSMGLYRHELDTGRFEKCAPPVDGLGINELIKSGDGRIVFATSDGRLWTLDPTDSERRARALNEDNAFAGLSNVTALASGSGSTIWAAAQGRLFRLDLNNPDPGARLTMVMQDIGTVSVMTLDRRGDLWIGRMDDDLLRYHPANGSVDRFPRAPRYTLALLVAKNGEIWIGARGGGLTRLDPVTGHFIVYRHDPENPASLSNDDVSSIYEDAVGSLWVGVWNGGVNRLDPQAQAFRTFRHRARVADSLPADDVTAMTETGDGSLWTASRSGVVGSGDPRTGRFRTAAVLSNGGSLRAIGALEDHILVGTSRGLVMLAAPSGREETLDPALDAQRLGERSIAVIRGGPGVAWIAAERALYRVVSGARVRVERFDVPFAGQILALSTPTTEAGGGRLWIGSDSGEVVQAAWSGAEADAAVVMQPLQVSGTSPRDTLAARGVVAALHEDRQGRLWIGTRRGLGRVELTTSASDPSGKVTWISQYEGLPSTNISSIVGDGDGLIWVGHNRGLTRLDASGAMTHFGDHDGVQGNGYAEGAWAQGRSGVIYLAGEGITAFDPREVGVSRSKPRIIFTSLEILHRVVAPKWLEPDSPLDRTIDAQSEVTLDSHANVFSVEMAPVHYADPPSNRLRYRLDGFDSAWIETDAQNRVATYTNLAPGTYVLRARAGTKHGLWSEQEAVLTIHLLPPWWRTKTALIGWAALGIAAALVIRRARRRRARVKLALLERESLRRDSLTDPLTGLHNRRFLLSWLQQEMPKLVREYRARGAASGADLLLLLIDVDHFKAINDRFSHGVGDRALALVAGVLKEHIRESDLAVRWGGDEFLVVTRSFQRARAADSAERLRAAVEALGKAEAAEGGPATTLSIGFAAYPFLPHAPEALTWEQTLELADHALLLSKRRRRNSYTGLRATPNVPAATVLEFLAKRGTAPLPDTIEILTPDIGEAEPEPASESATG